MTVTICQLDPKDVPQDQLEIKAFAAVSAYSFCGKIDGQVACIWGLVPPTILSDSAHLWMWSNDLCDQHPFLLVRHSQVAVEKMLKMYPLIVGYCDQEQKRSRQWLTWLGAKVGPSFGRLAPFEIRAKHG